MTTYFVNKDISRRSDMFKYNVGDKVIYRGKECKIIIQEYAKECTEGVVINEHKFYTVIDKDNNKYCCNEEELRRMRILDKIINSEDPYDALAELISEDCFNYCIYGNESCTDKDCKEGIKAYFNQEICASKEELIGVKRMEEELKTPDEHLEDAIKEKDQQCNDKVNHPSHYNQGIEAIDIIESWNLDFCLGNVIKYVLRAKYKGNIIEDLEKARWYLDREIDTLKNM